MGVERLLGDAARCWRRTLQIARVLRAALPGLLERGEGVGGLARLRDRHDDVAGADDRVAVAELAGDVDLDGDAGEALDQVAADHRRVLRGAAGEQDDARALAEVELEAVEADVVGLETVPSMVCRSRAAARGSP